MGSVERYVVSTKTGHPSLYVLLQERPSRSRSLTHTVTLSFEGDVVESGKWEDLHAQCLACVLVRICLIRKTQHGLRLPSFFFTAAPLNLNPRLI